MSNSVKYIQNKGEIEIKLSENNSEFIIQVIDNGLGIPENEIDKIFERFYQIERVKNYGSAGIGLALVKRFVELHHGSINVESNPGFETKFTIMLPKGEAHLKEKEKYESFAKKPREFFDFPQMMQKIKPVYKSVEHPEVKILVVEDNDEVRDYIDLLLSPLYTVIKAEDGLIGYDLAVSVNPDVIISDIMMPNMDGFEPCEKLKSNDKTKLIPTLLLTAKSAENYAVFGLKSGADDFISKPFDPDFLKEKIAGILHSRKILKEALGKKVNISGSEIEITPYDETMLKECIQLIEDNFLNPDLDADLIASQFNMSRSSLYRKLKGITGYSINHFIRKIRLDRAVQLLEDQQKTITEIAYEVGFNDLKYFRESFVKQFGSTPSKYRKGERSNENNF